MATPPPQPPPPPPHPFQVPPPQPPPGPPAPVDGSQVRPHRAWYWVAGFVAAIALAGSIVIFAGGDEDLGSLTSVLSTLEELDVPGEITVDLEAGAEWAIYSPTGSDAGPLASDLECEVRDPSGDLVPLVTDLGFSTVTLHGEVYLTEFTFDVAETGAYAVSCEPGNRAGTGGTLLVGEQVEIGEIFGFFGRVAAGIAVLLLGLLAACGIALPVWLSRSRKIGEQRRGGGRMS